VRKDPLSFFQGDHVVSFKVDPVQSFPKPPVTVRHALTVGSNFEIVPQSDYHQIASFESCSRPPPP